MPLFSGFPFGGGGFHNMGGDGDATVNVMQMNLKVRSIILSTIRFWVDKKASQTQIKKAYHPDKKGGEKEKVHKP